jgi:hypothetical protein
LRATGLRRFETRETAMLRFESRLATAVLGAALAVVLPAASRVAAQAPAQRSSPEHSSMPPAEETERKRGGRGDYYGWQTLTVDAAAVVLAGVVAATADVEPEPFNVFAATWYGVSAVAAPAVHYAHDNWPIGMASFGMRTLLPPVFGFFGLLASCTANEEFEGECARPGWATGSVIGLSGAALIDGLLLGYELTSDPPPPPRYWYGWQILVLDLAGFFAGGVAGTGIQRKDGGEAIHPALGTWVIGWTVGTIGAPIVHFTHGRVGIGFLSLGLRLMVGPMIGAVTGLVGYCAATAGADDCASHGAQWGLLAGAAAISLFDALVLAHEPTDDGDARYAPSPTIGPGTIGVRGYF